MSEKRDNPQDDAPLEQIRRIQDRANQVFREAEKCVPRAVPAGPEAPTPVRASLWSRLWSATRSGLAYAADLPFERFVMAFGLCVFASTFVFVVVRVSKGAPASEPAGQAGEPAAVAAAAKIQQPATSPSKADAVVVEASLPKSEPVLPEELASAPGPDPAPTAASSVPSKDKRDSGKRSLVRKPLALPGGVVVMPGEEAKPVFTGPGEMTPEPTPPPGQIPGNERGEIGPWAFN